MGWLWYYEKALDWDEVAFDVQLAPAHFAAHSASQATVTNMAAVVKSPNDPREYR